MENAALQTSETIDAASRNRIGGRNNYCQAGISWFKQHQMSWKASRRFSSNHVLAQPKTEPGRPAGGCGGGGKRPAYLPSPYLPPSQQRQRSCEASNAMSLSSLPRWLPLADCQPMKISSLLLLSSSAGSASACIVPAVRIYLVDGRRIRACLSVWRSGKIPHLIARSPLITRH